MLLRDDRKAIPFLPYSAGMISQSCWFIEFRKLMGLVSSGKSEEEIRWECLQNNLFGLSNEYRTKRVYHYLINRVSMLDAPLVDMFARGDVDTQKQINLIAILRGDRLFFEFLYEVYREKLLLGREELADMDFNAFFQQKGAESAVVEAWSDATKKHLRSNYTTCMTDAGLLKMDGRKRILQRPIVGAPLVQYMQSVGEEPVIRAIMGVM